MPVLFRSVLFGIFVLLFSVLEHLVEAVVHGEGIGGTMPKFRALGLDEIGARVLMLVVAFVPFFAFSELGRAIGPAKLAAMFFSERDEERQQQAPTS